MADRSDGGWIVIRPALTNHPKVVAMASRLAPLLGFKGPLRRYARHVIGWGLVLVWGAANEHTSDGTLAGMKLDGLDDIAGVDGFGVALARAGWAIETADGVTLPRFEEWNKTFKSRAAARQQKYRDKRNGKPGGTVTHPSRVTAPVTPALHESNHPEAEAEAESEEDTAERNANSTDSGDDDEKHTAADSSSAALKYLSAAKHFTDKILDPQQFVADMRQRFPEMDLLAVFQEAHGALSAGKVPRGGSVGNFLRHWTINAGTGAGNGKSDGNGRRHRPEQTATGEAGGAGDPDPYAGTEAHQAARDAQRRAKAG